MSQLASTPLFDIKSRYPEIMLRHLPEDVHATVEQVSANVSQSLDKLFGEFKNNIDKKAAEFEKGILPAELEQQLAEIADRYAQEMTNGFKTDFASLNTALAKAQASSAAVAATAPQVQADVAALAASVTALQKKLDEMHAKMKAFGGTSARLVIGGAVKYVTGGLV